MLPALPFLEGAVRRRVDRGVCRRLDRRGPAIRVRLDPRVRVRPDRRGPTVRG